MQNQILYKTMLSSSRTHGCPRTYSKHTRAAASGGGGKAVGVGMEDEGGK